MDHHEYTSAEFDKEHINSHFKNVLEIYVCKIFVEAITSNHDLLWLITWSISWVGWQIHSLSIHGWFHKINVILVHIWKVFFTLYVTVCTKVMVVNEFWTQRLIVLLFVMKVLGTCTCTWLKKYLIYLMPSKYCEYLYLYLNLQILKVLVLDSSTSESTWPQPCYICNLNQWWLRFLIPHGVIKCFIIKYNWKFFWTVDIFMHIGFNELTHSAITCKQLRSDPEYMTLQDTHECQQVSWDNTIYNYSSHLPLYR